MGDKHVGKELREEWRPNSRTQRFPRRKRQLTAAAQFEQSRQPHGKAGQGLRLRERAAAAAG